MMTTTCAAPNPRDIGSNNWVVSGTLTQSGCPMMANDPHRAQSAPSLRYWVHLVAPGWNVIGGGEPVLPGVSIGHNEYGAWGLTIFGTDSEDLYVYDTNPANPNQYQYRGAWEDMRVIKDTIPVKGEAPAAVELEVHAPRPGGLGRPRAPQGVRAARGVDGDRRRAVSGEPAHGSGADVGRVPRRVHLQPHPGGEHGVGRSQGQHRLSGGGDHAAAAELVRARARAGRRPLRVERLPADQRAAARRESGRRVTSRRRTTICSRRTIRTRRRCTTRAPIRFASSRISEVLGSRPAAQRRRHDAAAERRRVDPGAQPRAAASRRHDRRRGGEKARETLLAWDFSLDAESIAAGIYEMWQRRLGRERARPVVFPKDAQPFLGDRPSMKKIIDWLEAPDGRFGDDPTGGRDALLARSLTRGGRGADEEARRRHGALALGTEPVPPRADPPSDERGWSRPSVRAKLDVGPFPRGGDGYTVNATGSADNQTSGGSLKIIADTSNWDNSLGVEQPGAVRRSAEPALPRSFRAVVARAVLSDLLSRTKVESVVDERLTLRPSGASHQRLAPFAYLFLAALLCRRSQCARLPSDAGARAAAHASESGEIAIAGLTAPVRIVRDIVGRSAHLRAVQTDLFVAQGFVQAEDRLFQMDLWKRAAEGRLSEVLGANFVERDAMTRRVQYRGDLERRVGELRPGREGDRRGVRARHQRVGGDRARASARRVRARRLAAGELDRRSILNRTDAFVESGDALEDVRREH